MNQQRICRFGGCRVDQRFAGDRAVIRRPGDTPATTSTRPRKIVSHSHAAGHMTLVGLGQEIDRRHVIRYESLYLEYPF